MPDRWRSFERAIGRRSNTGIALSIALLACGCQNEPAAGQLSGMAGSAGTGGAAATLGGSGGVATAELAVRLPLYRLTNLEYDQSVRDLLKLEPTELASPPSSGFPVDGVVEKYAVGDTVSPLSVERAESAAERLATAAMAHPERLLSCDPAVLGEDACAQSFISEFGRRAYRRPLSDDDKAALLAQYQLGKTNGAGFLDGIELVVQTALLSTYFLFHVPALGGEPSGTVVDVVDWEMASRLSYFLWGTMPDDALFAAAEAGQLRTAPQIRAQAERMLADARAQDSERSFLEQTFEPSKVAAVNRDPLAYPEFNAGVAAALAGSYQAFLQDAYATGTFDAFFRSPKLFVNQELATLYGLSGVTGSGLVPVMAPSERLGILTQPGFLTLKGKFDRSDPIHRGVYVVRNLLCRTLPDPPPNALQQMPDSTLPQDTTRQQVEAKTAAPACKACHGMINPFGFGLEGFDALGRVRTHEATATAGSLPVDATGSTTLDDAAEVTTWSSALELANAIASSREARRCFTQNMYRFAHRRPAEPQDDAEIAAITGDFVAAGEQIPALLLRVVDSRAFSKRVIP